MRNTESLAKHRLLPRAEREDFLYEIVRFHLEDLNALAERRLARRRRASIDLQDRGRAAAIVQAARWDRAGFLTAIRRFVDEGRAGGAEAFGPMLLLLALRAHPGPSLTRDSTRIRELAEALLQDVDTKGRRKPGPSPARRR